jgi:hypothetical protein
MEIITVIFLESERAARVRDVWTGRRFVKLDMDVFEVGRTRTFLCPVVAQGV